MSSFFKDNHLKLIKFRERIVETIVNLENKDLVIQIVTEMINRRAESMMGSFNLCTFNAKYIGDEFLGLIESPNIEEHWQNIIIDILRFCKEFECRSNIFLESLHKFILYYHNKIVSLNAEVEPQIYYALIRMPFDIQEEIYSEKYAKFRNNIDEEINATINKKFPNQKKEIEKLKEDNENYINLLKGFKQKFSFLALNQAFNKLEKSKQIARYISLLILFLLAGLIVYIPYFYYEKSFLIKQMTEIFNLTLNNENSSMSLFILFSGLIPMIFIESIFIYYFKIVLNKYNSITDQIIQLETKQAIMQFIESYINYKKDNNIKHEEMSKFEEIIFSQISPNLKDVPSSPDLASLIDSISKAFKSK